MSSRDVQAELGNEALRYAEEGLEVARHMRDEDFLSLVPGSYGLSFDGSEWSLGPAPETIDSYYSRTLTIRSVYRDGSGNIVSTGGTLDPASVWVESEVQWTWRGVRSKEVVLESLLTNWSAWEWEQTTCTDFAAGSFTNTSTTAAAAPPADNCVLQLDLVEEAGEFFVSTDIGEHGNAVVVDSGYAYVATHKNSEGLAVVDVSDINSPSVLGNTNIGARGRSVHKEGNYLYMGVQKSSAGLAIVNVSDPNSPSVSSTINIGGYGNDAVTDGNDNLFIAVEDSSAGFLVYDVSSPSSPSSLASLNLGAAVNAVSYDSGYVYAGVEDDDSGLQIIDVSTPSSPSVVGTLDVDSEVTSLWVEGSFAYLGTEDSDSGLVIVDISTPESPILISSLDVDGQVEDVAKSGSYLYLALDQISPGMAVVNANSPAAPYLAFSIDVGGKGTSVTIDGDEVFVGVDTANQGLVILGDADVSVASSGSFTSSILDLGSEDVRYNYLDWEATIPAGGSMDVQLRTASSSGGLSAATWVGPDGTNGTVYDSVPSSVTIDPSASGLRFVEMKIDFTSDGFTSPALDSISLYYQP